MKATNNNKLVPVNSQCHHSSINNPLNKGYACSVGRVWIRLDACAVGVRRKVNGQYCVGAIFKHSDPVTRFIHAFISFYRACLPGYCDFLITESNYCLQNVCLNSTENQSDLNLHNLYFYVLFYNILENKLIVNIFKGPCD